MDETQADKQTRLLKLFAMDIEQVTTRIAEMKDNKAREECWRRLDNLKEAFIFGVVKGVR